jgi:hypothetical protein
MPSIWEVFGSLKTTSGQNRPAPYPHILRSTYHTPSPLDNPRRLILRLHRSCFMNFETDCKAQDMAVIPPNLAHSKQALRSF